MIFCTLFIGKVVMWVEETRGRGGPWREKRVTPSRSVSSSYFEIGLKNIILGGGWGGERRVRGGR